MLRKVAKGENVGQPGVVCFLFTHGGCGCRLENVATETRNIDWFEVVMPSCLLSFTGIQWLSLKRGAAVFLFGVGGS